VVNFTPRLLYPRERAPRFPLGRWLGGPQPVWTTRIREKSCTSGNRMKERKHGRGGGEHTNPTAWYVGYPEISRGFLQFLQANAKIVPQLGEVCFFPNPFQCMGRVAIRGCIVWDTDCVVKQPTTPPPPAPRDWCCSDCE
jgi:hypothetical protein